MHAITVARCKVAQEVWYRVDTNLLERILARLCSVKNRAIVGPSYCIKSVSGKLNDEHNGQRNGRQAYAPDGVHEDELLLCVKIVI